MSRVDSRRKTADKVILALDVDRWTKAAHLLKKMEGRIKIYKIGLQLFSKAGPEAIKAVQKKGAQVFLDLKLFDIPNTVSSAVREAVRLKVMMLTLHISGGEEMLRSAVEAARQESVRLKVQRPLLIGVTVLTSQDAGKKEVLRLARSGLNCGLDGVVCSAREAAYLRKNIKRQFIIITPGIRPAAKSGDDQKRVVTASAALKAGSDFLVVGRPILQAKDPVAALKELVSS